MTKQRLPSSFEEWRKDIARAYLDAQEAQPFGEAIGEPIPDSKLFHLAPHVCIKFRKIRASKRKRTQIVEGTLASYVVTMDEGTGGDELRDSPILSFAFCYLAAYFVADLLDQETVERLMEMCVARKDDLARLVSGGA